MRDLTASPSPPTSLRAGLWLLALALTTLTACSQPPNPDVSVPPGHQGPGEDDPTSASDPTTPSGASKGAPDTLAGDACPIKQRVDAVPGVDPEEQTLEFWLAQLGAQHDLDEALMTPAQARNLSVAVGTHEVGQHTTLPDDDQRFIRDSVRERLAYLHERLSDGRYVERSGALMSPDALARFDPNTPLPELAPSLHVATDVIPLRCGPRAEGFFKPDLDLAFDRNNCSSAHPQELVEVLLSWPGGMKFARTRYSMGWIPADAPLTPLPPALRQTFARGERVRATQTLSLSAGAERAQVQAGARLLPVPGQPQRVYFANTAGVHQSEALPASALASTATPLTRRAWLEAAFAHLNEPYGWGGQDGARDCSRFLLDVFAAFNIHLPRFSGDQAKSGTFTIDISGVEKEHERVLLIEAAAKKGIVLMRFPGHIMMYLGKNKDGEPMAIHSFAEFVSPCGQDVETQNPSRETLMGVHKITVSDLELGRDSSRGAFIERITQLTVIGQPAGVALQGVAAVRDAAPLTAEVSDASCVNQTESRIFVSPEVPSTTQPLRIIATHTADPGPGQLALIAPDGRRVTPEVQRFGGPPFTAVATIEQPTAGEWTLAYGEGESLVACERITVSEEASPRSENGRYVWTPRDAWNQNYENLYAAFVESLFAYDLSGDPTWKNLHTVLRDPERNILFNHLGHGEEMDLEMVPDCADLPYMLRGYFAWKMGLPFGFRRCNRGRANRPPTCEKEPSTNLMSGQRNVVRAFRRFINGAVRNTVHSGCGRTDVFIDETDFYPVPMTREALRPGTMYADPYGHLLVVTRWRPQGTKDYGVLIAADGQPDGTLGLKRFWRGTFLFISDTAVAGAGFKAFRPLVKDRNKLRPLTNEELKTSPDHVPYSLEQYSGTKDDFYNRMDALINTRPLDPFGMQTWLIDAFEEAIQFRLIAVNNGIEFRAKSNTITMPKGQNIFHTNGPWEDFSTPSRDMRVLIALDTVINFPEVVRAAPERFGLDPKDDLDATIESLKTFLDAELARRAFSYNRSNGQAHTLTLRDIVDRRVDLEMAYNPNDCVEVRWAAPEGSEERSSCERRAPSQQLASMKKYREWFSTRERPIH